MDLYEVVDQAARLLQQRGRLTYRLLKRQFNLDDDVLDDLKEELLFTCPVVDEDGRGLAWTGDPSAPALASPSPSSALPEILPEVPTTPDEPPPAEMPGSDAERRQLTVMFCDLVDSTRLSGSLDPEDLRDVIRAYQAACTEVIERFGGYIAQHLGDGLMVYFGWPQAHEDNAQRAVRAGLGIVDALGPLNDRLEREQGIRLAVRIGIHTGLVVIGEIGTGASQEQLALGETPNVAARLEGVSSPNQIVISVSARRLLGQAFNLQDLGSHTLKGLSEPLQLYGILGERTGKNRFEASTLNDPIPLVGREEEIGLILRRWEQAKASEGQVVLLSGEAGIGKSRIVQAVRGHIASDSHLLMRLQGSPYYTNTAFYPITEQITHSAGFARDDTAEQKLDKLETHLEEMGLVVSEVAPLLAAVLLIPLGDRYTALDLSPQQQKERTFVALADRLLAVAEQQPLLFIVEDLHWSDPTSLESIGKIIEVIQEARVLVLGTHRPGFASPWGLQGLLTTLSLNRLSRSQSYEMISELTEGKRLPAEVLDQLVVKSDGIPLFVEEMTKSLLESEWLEEKRDHYNVVTPLPLLAIPSTLQDALMARLDRSEEAKEVAQIGAIFGREFSYERLRAVTPFEEARLQAGLSQLVDAELCYQRGTLPQATYTFKHALVRDAAYDSLLRSSRQHYHRRIAQVLEERFAETADIQPEVLAHHFTQGMLPEKAIGYWQQAGEYAGARSAYVETLTHLRKGLDVLQSLPDTPEHTQRELTLQLAQAEALSVVKGYTAPELEPIYQRAHKLGKLLDAVPQLVSTLQLIRRYYMMRLEFETARQFGVELLDLARRQDDPSSLQEGHWGLGQTLYFLGDMLGARTHLEQSAACYNPQPLTTQASRDLAGTQIACLITLGRTVWVLGYPDQSRRYTRQGLSLAQELSHPFTLAYAHHAAAEHAFLCRDIDDALEQSQAAFALSNEHDFPVWTASSSVVQGWVFAMQGQSDKGLRQIREILVSHREVMSENNRQTAFVMLAEVNDLAGRGRDGLQTLSESLALVDKTGGSLWEAELYRLQGILLSQETSQQQTDEVEACFYKALDIAGQQQAKSWELRATTSLARLWRSQGKRQDAYDLLAPVYEWFTEGFDTTDLKEAKSLLDDLLEGAS